MQMRSHMLAYTAGSRITGISGSPVVCEFYGYGGNSTDPNFRLALSQENGDIAIIDVNTCLLYTSFAGYYIHPAAPPWYAINYGFEPVLNTPGNVAGLGRFDA